MAASLQVGSEFAGCEIVSVVGRGGMGVVYAAIQPDLGRRVAIKVIAPEFAQDANFRERFKRESRVAATIEHPHAIPIYEAGVADDETLYLVMRYVEGSDLSAILAAEGRLQPARAAALVSQVAGALDEAHRHGLVHRDVKPANIVISTHGGVDHAYLTDFGLTKATAASGGLTATGQWLGTPDYAAPEQLEGKRIDARTDVYALGCLLHQAVTGRVPFEREGNLARMFAHVNEPPPRPTEVVPELPAEFDEVIARALAKSPDDRYSSAGDLGRAALAAASGERARTPERAVAAGEAAPVADETQTGATRALPRDPAPAATEVLAAATAGTAAPSASTAPKRRRGWAVGLGLVAVVVAGGAIALATGIVGGDDDPGGGGEAAEAPESDSGLPGNLEFAPISTGAYTVEVPVMWKEVEVEALAGDPPGSFLRTELVSQGEQGVRLAINRVPGGASSPEEFATQAEAENVGQEGYERIRFEPVTVGGDREAFLWEYDVIDEELGQSRAVAYFFDAGDDAYRVQATAAAGMGRLSQPAPVALRAAETLEP